MNKANALILHFTFHDLKRLLTAPTLRLSSASGRIFGAKFDYFFALVHGSAHARELIDAKNQLSSGLFTQANRRYLRFLIATIVGAAERRKLYPNRVRLEPDAVAELLVRSTAGNELYGTTPPTPTVFRRWLDALVRVFVVGLGGQISR